MEVKRYILFILILSGFPIWSAAQERTDLKGRIECALTSLKPKHLCIDTIRIEDLRIPKRGTIVVRMNDEFSYLPFREELVTRAYDTVRILLPEELKHRQLSIRTGGYEISRLIPFPSSVKRFTTHCSTPLVTPEHRLYPPTLGLQNRHIALWQSHGYYFEPSLNRWEWQRARLHGTVEDLYTQSYVLPFLIPMLENAGAYILSPRERDTHSLEWIVDNDMSQGYHESRRWEQGGVGFASIRPYYTEGQNPFTDGTFRQTETTRDEQAASQVCWETPISQSGEYALYVAYHTVKNSTDDARYTVYHQGRESSFRVNQTMGGGTWIYLGHFDFADGDTARVTLSNHSRRQGAIVTADAVKIGGGTGTIARRHTNTDSFYTTSGYPRFTEAARYWLQSAGFPERVYSPSKNKNDYTDDYKCRGEWVNYLAGGSEVLPQHEGLNIPVDLALAFHSDAGTTPNDSIIGSLGIYFTGRDRKVYKEDVPRLVSRTLADLVLTQVTEDIRLAYEPAWSRRGMWNKSYFEARVPEVPTLLLELLSHQNFADMRYGLDPRFRFLVSRAVYKGILKFIAGQHRSDYVVQPLPVSHLHTRFTDTHQATLSWRPVHDSWEATASPDRYIVYTRIGSGAFDAGTLVTDTTYTLSIQPDSIYSFKVTAVNRGGESFPSEILSLCQTSHSKGTVMVINGFDRVSAPDSFEIDTLVAGFDTRKDFGVPYLRDICFVGEPYEFRRARPWVDDDNPGFGASRANYETQVIAGNSFDYPYRHGLSIVQAGYSFLSASDEAISERLLPLNEYPFVDLILGKEKEVLMGNGKSSPEFSIFSPALRQALTDYCRRHRGLFISGSYIGSDLWDNLTPDTLEQRFAQDILHYTWRTGQASTEGKVAPEITPLTRFNHLHISYHHQLNPICYAVESPDGIEPFGKGSYTLQRYSDTRVSAGVFYSGEQYCTCVLGYPFESIQTQAERDALMKAILDTFREAALNAPDS